MSAVSLCITSYDKDIHLLSNLLRYLTLQTVAPEEIIIYCSGINNININQYINIQNIKVPIVTVINKSRQLQSTARNTCANYANQELLTYCDVDDIPHPQKIETIKAHMLDYDFLVHSYKKQLDTKYFDLFNVHSIATCDNLYIDPNPNSTNIESNIKQPICHGHLTIKKQIFYNNYIMIMEWVMIYYVFFIISFLLTYILNM
jgi:glycosyltransferase involved in cell wall biosynthesis